MLLMNLILAELLVSLYGIPVDFLASWREGWKMGPRLCKVTGFILTALGEIIIIFRYVYSYVMIGMSSMNSLTSMSVYRWILIKHEVSENQLFPNVK